MAHRASLPRALLTEAHVQRLWQLQAFRRDSVRTEEGRSLEVLFPGLPCVEGGPDFRAARLKIDGDIRVGDVEVHLTPRGWHAHGHARDGAYDGVILHVVLDRDGVDLPGPAVTLRPYLAASSLQILRGEGAEPPPPWAWPEGEEEAGRFLEAAGRVRWERRRRRFAREAGRAGAAEAMHRSFFTALGFRRNRGPFRELARLVPAAELAGLPGGVVRERLAEGAERVAFWRRAGVRPANAPERRLDAAAGILARGRILDAMRNRSAEEAVGALMDWGGLGKDRARSIYVHAVLPGLEAAHGEAVLRNQRPLAPNRREKEALLLAPPSAAAAVSSALHQMGLLELLEAATAGPGNPRLRVPEGASSEIPLVSPRGG